MRKNVQCRLPILYFLIYLVYVKIRYCKVRKVKLSLCLTNSALRHEGVWGSGCIDLHFLDLGTSWR
jgi:hypothetical protein